MKHIGALQVSRGKGAALCCIAVLGKVVDVIIRYFSGKLVDNGINQNAFMGAWLGITAICGINLLLQYLDPYTKDIFEASYTGVLFSKLEDKILYSKQEHIDKRRIGEFSTCFSSDIFGILQYVERMLLVLIPDIISFTICVFLLMNMRVILGLTALFSGLISAFFMTRLSRGMAKSLGDYQNKLKSTNGLITDGLFNLEMVKVNGMEKGFIEQYADELKQLHEIKSKVDFRQALLSAPTVALSFITLISIAFCGGYFVIMGQMSVGQLLSAVTLSDFIVSPVMRFENSLGQYRRAAVNLKNYSIFEEMEQEKDFIQGIKATKATTVANEEKATKAAKAANAEKAAKSINAAEAAKTVNAANAAEAAKAALECGISNLSFCYPDGSKVFERLNMRFEKGKINYISQHNGSGKSTLVKIIGGIYEIDRGEINLPVESNDRNCIRNTVSIMPQESPVFGDSIKANLLAGTSCPEEKMYRVCETLGLDGEIRNMEKGYDTMLKEKGAPLSGGQKKRIAFIRSVLCEADVYIFDEPTANIDLENAIRMMEYISELAGRHYVIVITHDKNMMDRYPGVVQVLKSNMLEENPSGSNKVS